LSTIADESYLLSEGRVVAAGSPQELLKSDSPMVHQFMTGSPDGPVPFHYPAGDYTSELLAVEES
jgi:phospholipid/cholesterol/gamma-HCH transport system ATP-binding protein